MYMHMLITTKMLLCASCMQHDLFYRLWPEGLCHLLCLAQACPPTKITEEVMRAVQAVLSIGGSGPVVDIAVSGVPGWVALRTEQNQGRLQLRIWAPAGIEVYVRPPLPVS